MPFVHSALLMLSVLAAGSIFGYPLGTELPRPALVKGERFTLRPVQLETETRVVLFFYSASWCAPCRETGEAVVAKLGEGHLFVLLAGERLGYRGVFQALIEDGVTYRQYWKRIRRAEG
ncbi:hypothetical protein, partial [uncultured Thiohalocapsa sp.]|uniref:hypothetical protein n=1 Tax=uncultured Thiohalocapsa sp. TaxID=768990 RepID=UPI0025E8BC5C